MVIPRFEFPILGIEADLGREPGRFGNDDMINHKVEALMKLIEASLKFESRGLRKVNIQYREGIPQECNSFS